MKNKIHLKKMLIALGLLAVAVPLSLSVVACNNKVETDTRIKLTDAFSDFQFSDTKNVAGFLDANNLDLITKQILNHLNLDSLETSGLVLENQTSNSIILKAKADAKDYQGEVKLSWNLKLMEIYGIGIGTPNPLTRDGLKGYFYLEQETNLIKFFNAFKYFHGFIDGLIHPVFPKYHHFIFSNKDDDSVSKDFTIDGKWWIGQLPGKFGSFAFAPLGITFSVTTPESSRVRLFDAEKNDWIGIGADKSFDVDSLGQISEKE